MKKWQLLKIQDSINLKKLKHTNYLSLLDFTDEQIEIIINNLNKETISILVDFFSLLNNGKYDFSDFERLGIVNIEEIIIDKILNAKNNEQAIIILNWFKYKIDKFETKEEWQTFMDNLSGEISISNLSYVIDTFKISRPEAIEKVMKNAIDLRTIYLCDVNKKNKLSEVNLLDLLDLVIMKYDVKLSSKLIKQLVKRYSTQSTVYDEVLKYLRNPVIFHKDLPKLFLNVDINELTYILEILQKIDNQRLLDKYVSFDLKNENKKVLDDYINKICEEENDVLKNAMILLLENKENFENIVGDDKNKLSTAIDKLKVANKEDNRSLLMAKLFDKIPYDIWIIIPNNIDLLKLECIYENNKTLIDIINIIDKKIIIERINYLNLSNLIKIFAIVRLKSFIKSFKVADELCRLFNSESEIIIDNAYKKYLLEEEKNRLLEKTNMQKIGFSDELELKRLGNILENGYDIDLVLAAYQDDEEITSNTLIKTMS